jgi:PEP-CTERM motif
LKTAISAKKIRAQISRGSGALLIASIALLSLAGGGTLFLRHKDASPASKINAKVLSFPGVQRNQYDGASANYGSAVSGRQLYPYSVVPGGVATPDELKSAVLRDPVVAAHYADFDVAKARLIRLQEDHAFYVSYRLGNHIYWTKNKLTLFKGEALLTDGKHEARTRCANRLSDTLVSPMSAKQPKLEAMEAAPNMELVPGPLSVDGLSSSSPEALSPLLSPGGVSGTAGGLPEFVSLPPEFPIVGGGSGSPRRSTGGGGGTPGGGSPGGGTPGGGSPGGGTPGGGTPGGGTPGGGTPGGGTPGGGTPGGGTPGGGTPGGGGPPTAVPEPGTLLLLGVGLGATWLRKKRKS